VWGVEGAGAVERAVAQHNALDARGAGDRVLQFGQRRDHGGVGLWCVDPDRFLLAGEPWPRGWVEKGDALGDHPTRSGRDRGLDQMPGSFPAQPVGGLGAAAQLGEAVGQRGELMDHHFGSGFGDRAVHRVRVECIADHGGGACCFDQPGSRRRAGASHHVVAGGDEHRHQRPAQHAGRPSDEHLHRLDPTAVDRPTVSAAITE